MCRAWVLCNLTILTITGLGGYGPILQMGTLRLRGLTDLPRVQCRLLLTAPHNKALMHETAAEMRPDSWPRNQATCPSVKFQELRDLGQVAFAPWTPIFLKQKQRYWWTRPVFLSLFSAITHYSIFLHDQAINLRVCKTEGKVWLNNITLTTYDACCYFLVSLYIF